MKILSRDEMKQEARRMREQIYGPIADDAWGNIADNWLNDFVWLKSKTDGFTHVIANLPARKYHT